MNDTTGPLVSFRAMGPCFFEESIMRSATAVLALLLSALTTYLLLAKMPYRGPETEIGIVDGPDVNVPYHEKYGLLGYAFARDFYEDGRVVERRIESLNPLRLAISSCLVSLAWLATYLLIIRVFKRRAENAKP